MGNVFSEESVNNGTFVRFISIITIAVLTIMMGTVYSLSIIYHFSVPDIFGQLLIGGIVFFAKTAGIAVGANLNTDGTQNAGRIASHS